MSQNKEPELKEVFDAMKTMQWLCEQRDQLQRVIIEWLVYRYGGMRKAAAAMDIQPSNFCNLRSGKRKASIELLGRMIAKVQDQQPGDAGEE